MFRTIPDPVMSLLRPKGGRTSGTRTGTLQPPNKYHSQSAWRQPGSIGQTVVDEICADGDILPLAGRIT